MASAQLTLQHAHDLVVANLAQYGQVTDEQWNLCFRQLSKLMLDARELPNNTRRNHALTLLLNVVNLIRSNMLLSDFARDTVLRAQFEEQPDRFLHEHMELHQQFDRLVELSVPLLDGSPLLKHQVQVVNCFNVTVQQLLLYHVTMRMDSATVFRASHHCVRLLQLQQAHMSRLLTQHSSLTLAKLSTVANNITQSVKYMYYDMFGLVHTVRYSLDFLTILLQTFDKLDKLGLNVNHLVIVLLDLASALHLVVSQPEMPLLRNTCVQILQFVLLHHARRVSPTLVVLVNNHSLSSSSRMHLMAISEPILAPSVELKDERVAPPSRPQRKRAFGDGSGRSNKKRRNEALLSQ